MEEWDNAGLELVVVVVVVVVVETWGANQVLIATGFMIFMGDEGNEGGTGGNKLLYLGTRPSEMSPRNFPGGGGKPGS